MQTFWGSANSRDRALEYTHLLRYKKLGTLRNQDCEKRPIFEFPSRKLTVPFAGILQQHFGDDHFTRSTEPNHLQSRCFTIGPSSQRD